ncbi:MAG: glycosyltransferase family 4 protein [Alphaproteobacteria bacterium]|nr:glycosyltransferase family 4 protein [Alphaproteobacteria bacterium]
MKAGPRLLLVFSRFMSLGEWSRIGMFERETIMYRRLAERGVQVGFITYGGRGELRFADQLPGISIFPNQFGLSPSRYERFLPFLHAKAFLWADIVKTNQVSSVHAALPGVGLWNKRLVARLGYMPSDFALRQHGPGSAEHLLEDAQERRLFGKANAIVVTTQAMADDIAQRLPTRAVDIQVIPNYVDTEQFAPRANTTPAYDVIFIGRLAEQKNISALLEALSISKAKTLLVGDGPQADRVRLAVSKAHGLLEWRPSLPNTELPTVLAQAKLFVLPSLWEGHPKTLLEAMSCGLAVLGADSPGISSQIEHGRTGWLCAPTPQAMAQAMQHLLAQDDLRASLGTAARQRILGAFALDLVVAHEHALYTRLIKA